MGEGDKVRNKESPRETWKPEERARGLTRSIRRSENVALVVEAAAVVAGVKGLGVFLPGFRSPEV